MKASDLRIGNYVKDRSERIIQVEQVLSWGINLESDCYGGWTCEFSEDYISGIPLTEEWLLKFGFEFNPDPSWKYKDDDGKDVEVESRPYWYKIYKDGKFDMRFYWYLDSKKANNCSCEYVHQIQNAYFALTGEELTLKK